jgi:trk system potassium uptake protein TrkA
MKVIVIGAGEVGYHIAKFLSREQDIDVVVIDTDHQKLGRISEELDIAVVEGEGGSPRVLGEAGADDADILLAVTNSDEINMISCLVAKALFNVKRKIARIRNEEYFTNRKLLEEDNLDINPAINPELESARAIIRIIETPSAYDVEEFENGIIKVIGFRVKEDSFIAGKSLKDLREQIGQKILIGIIQRGDSTIIPKGNDRIEPRDVVYLPIHRDNIERVAALIRGDVRPVRNVMMIGGGRIGFHVARVLEKSGVSLKIVENSQERCKYLIKHLEDTVVLHGNGADRGLLEEENAGSMDVFAAITNNEELNIMSSLLAKSMGARRVITVVNKTEYLPLAHDLGIEVVISPRLITASSILRYVRRGDILSLTAIAEDMAEIIEAGVSSSSPLAGKRLMDAEIPRSALVGAIIRDQDVIIPGGEDVIRHGDRLIIFTLYESIKKVEKLLI